MPGLQVTQLDPTHLGTNEPDDRMPDGVAHALHLVMPAFGDHQLEPRVRRALANNTHLSWRGFARQRPVFFAEAHTLLQSAELTLIRTPRDFDHVGLRNVKFRMQEVVRECAVVGEQQQAFRVEVETTDREDARHVAFEALAAFRARHTDDVDHGLAPFRIADRRNHVNRLVHRNVDDRLGRHDAEAIDFDRIFFGVRLSAELVDDLAVDANTPFADELLGGASRSDTGLCQNFL